MAAVAAAAAALQRPHLKLLRTGPIDSATKLWSPERKRSPAKPPNTCLQVQRPALHPGQASQVLLGVLQALQGCGSAPGPTGGCQQRVGLRDRALEARRAARSPHPGSRHPSAGSRRRCRTESPPGALPAPRPSLQRRLSGTQMARSILWEVGHALRLRQHRRGGQPRRRHAAAATDMAAGGGAGRRAQRRHAALDDIAA